MHVRSRPTVLQSCLCSTVFVSRALQRDLGGTTLLCTSIRLSSYRFLRQSGEDRRRLYCGRTAHHTIIINTSSQQLTGPWFESWRRTAACICLLYRSLQVVGSSLGVLAAYSAGWGNQSLRQQACLLALSVIAAAVTTAACSWLVGDIIQNVSLLWGRFCTATSSVGTLLLTVR